MKKLYTVFALITATGLTAFSQNLVNDAGTININPGATITVTGNFVNSNAASVNNAGVMEVAGNFTSTGISSQQGAGIYRFNGIAQQNLSLGDEIITGIEVDNTAGLLMASNAGGLTKLNFVNGHILAGANTLTMASINNAVTGADTAKFFICGDNGLFKYNGVGVGDTAYYPVGYSDTTFNALTIVNAGAEDNFSVRVFNDVLQQGTTGATVNPTMFSLVPRTWVVTEDVQGGTQPTYTFEWTATQSPMITSTFWEAGSGGVYNWYPYLNTAYLPVNTNHYAVTIPFNQPYWPSNSATSPLIIGYEGYFFYPEGVEENPYGAVSLYPNPVNGGSLVQIKSKGLQGKVSLALYDNTGRLVLTETKTAMPEGTMQLAMPTLSKGLYLLTLTGDKGKYATKVSVQ